MQQATSHWTICWSMIRHFFICPESNPSGRVEEVSVGRNCCIVDPLWTLHSVEPWVSMSTTVEIVAAIIILWQTLLDSSQLKSAGRASQRWPAQAHSTSPALLLKMLKPLLSLDFPASAAGSRWASRCHRRRASGSATSTRSRLEPISWLSSDWLLFHGRGLLSNRSQGRFLPGKTIHRYLLTVVPIQGLPESANLHPAPQRGTRGRNGNQPPFSRRQAGVILVNKPPLTKTGHRGNNYAIISLSGDFIKIWIGHS